jgi:hypothetical protein
MYIKKKKIFFEICLFCFKVQNEIPSIVFETQTELIDVHKFIPILYDYLEIIQMQNVHLEFISKY